MRHPAQIVHHIPGRIRIKLPRAKGNRALLNRIAESIEGRHGVRSVSVNATTGSVIIYYDSSVLGDFRKRLAEYGADDDLFTLKKEGQEDKSLTARSIGGALKFLSQGVKRVTGDVIDLREIFPLAIGAYAFFFVDRAVGAPLWLSMLFFSFDSYMDLHEDESNEPVVDSVESLRDEIAALRAEVRALSGRNQLNA